MGHDLNVIKVGGSLLSHSALPRLIRALAPRLKPGKSVLVHGGGKEITALAEKLGIRSRFVEGRRFTDEPLMKVVEMALSGNVNPFFVGSLKRWGVPALGLSGRDAELVRAVPVPGLGRVGLPSRVNGSLLSRLAALGTVPVFASIASDGRGGALNVNADEMAGALAMALRARRLILFTDVPGILDARGKTVPHLSIRSGTQLIRRGVITGGMIPKIRSAFRALQSGVGEVWVLEGRLPLSRARGTLVSHRPSSRTSPF